MICKSGWNSNDNDLARRVWLLGETDVGGRDRTEYGKCVESHISKARCGAPCGPPLEKECGDDSSGENVEGHAERGPPGRDSGILNDEVVEKVVDAVACERGGGDPLACLEADHSKDHECAGS